MGAESPEKIPRFMKPEWETDEQLKHFLNDLAGLRSDSDSRGNKADRRFKEILDKYPGLLDHYVNYNGQKTHVIKLLVQDANEQAYIVKSAKQELTDPLYIRQPERANYWPFAQLAKLPEANDAMIKAALDPQLAGGIGLDGQRVSLGSDMLNMAVKRHNDELIVRLIDAGVSLDVSMPESNILVYLTPGRPDEFSQSSYAKIADALNKRRGEDREFDYSFMNLVASRKDYPRLEKMIAAGYPLHSADAARPSIPEMLRLNGIPPYAAEGIARALEPRTGMHENRVREAFTARLHPEETHFIDMYRPGKGLPLPVLHRAEQLALVEAYHIADSVHPPQMGSTRDIAMLIDKTKAAQLYRGFIDGSGPQNKNVTAASLLSELATHAPTWPSSKVNGQGGYDYQTGEEYQKVIDDEGRAENTAKTPLGKILLDVQARDKHGATQADIMRDLDTQIDRKRKEYGLSDER